MHTADAALVHDTLAVVAPGTELREGLERILRGQTGALVVLGHDEAVEGMSSGGFPLDVEFTATRLRELAKMDGAIVLSSDLTRIVRAGAQLLPDPSIPTSESGMRHRTAERVSRQTGRTVITVSQSMNMAALYVRGIRYVLDPSTRILSRANQALAILERYKMRLDTVTSSLAALEIENLATVRDVALVLQRQEMVARISDEVRRDLVLLGTDGHFLTLQLEELTGGMERDRDRFLRDYAILGAGDGPNSERLRTAITEVRDALRRLSPTALLDPQRAVEALGLSPESIDDTISPRGYRLLSRVPRIPPLVVDRLLDHFETLPHLLAAVPEDLMAVDGVGEARARAIIDGLSRLTEASMLDRFA